MRSKLNSTIKCDINLQLSTLSTWVCCCKTYWLSEIAYIPLFLASQKVAGHPLPRRRAGESRRLQSEDIGLYFAACSACSYDCPAIFWDLPSLV